MGRCGKWDADPANVDADVIEEAVSARIRCATSVGIERQLCKDSLWNEHVIVVIVSSYVVEDM